MKRSHLASGKNISPLSLLNLFNKTYNKADHIKTYILIAIANQKTSKAIIPNQVNHSIYYHVIYQYCSIYYAFSTLPLHLPSGFYLNVYTIATCDQWWWLIYGLNKKLWCMLIVWHQNHQLLLFITPGIIFYNTQQVSLICPHSGIEWTLN